MNCLVTGGAGFIGSHLTAALLKRGDSVRVLDNLSTGHQQNIPDGAEFHFGSILAPLEELKSVFNGIDAVFHFAANPSVRASVKDPMETHMTIANGTVNVLEAARAAGVKRFVLASSCSVYGQRQSCFTAEDEQWTPLSPYGVAKACAEHSCCLFSPHFESTTVLRFFNIWGERQAGGFVVPAIRKAKETGELFNLSGFKVCRDFVHVDDAVRATLEASDLPGSFRLLNVGSGRGTLIKDLLTWAKVSGVLYDQLPCDPESCVANTSKFRETLGWVPDGRLKDLYHLLSSP